MRQTLSALFASLFLFVYHSLSGQIYVEDRNITEVSQEKLKRHVYVLADTLARGRATGTPEATLSANYIKQCFQRYGLMPYNDLSYFQSFQVGEVVGRNVAAILRGRSYPQEFVVISAHYDHLGTINGTIYPGADDNASGVAMLLQIAELFAQRARKGDAPQRSMIFVAYDAKELELSGSKHFAQTLRMAPQRIMANLNIDQIGCILEPPHMNPEYALVVGADLLTPDLRLIIDVANRYFRIGLDIDYTYYGSPAFSDIFFRLGDQIHLANLHIPSILYTSGIHAYTYKPTDLPALINYPVLQKRTQLLYLIADDLVSRSSWLRRKR
jgi:Zn-dependent M28 family amino/carboxypeptidase